MSRPAALQAFYDALDGALLASRPDYEGRHVPEMVLASLRASTGSFTLPDPAATRPPVVALVPDMLAEGKYVSPEITRVCEAIEAMQPLMSWRQRRISGPDADHFYENHATAIVLGKNGIESHDRFTIGISLASANTAYPEHDHDPEELYLILAPSDFMHQPDDWQSCEIGDTFYNTPAVRHAMRAREKPMLAIWIFGNW